MLKQHHAASWSAPDDLINIIKQVDRELAAGLKIGDAAAVAMLARQLERDLTPRIVADRRYSINEIKRQFGFTHSAFYKRHKAIIRKDGRKSYVIGRELLAVIADGPTLASVVPPPPISDAAAAPPGRRGRPRNIVPAGAVGAAARADIDAAVGKNPRPDLLLAASPPPPGGRGRNSETGGGRIPGRVCSHQIREKPTQRTAGHHPVAGNPSGAQLMLEARGASCSI